MKPFAVACLMFVTFAVSCSKGRDDDNGGNPPPPPPPGGPLTITGTSPEYVFWGKELTIDGTGFSTTANDNIVYIKGNKACVTDTTWQKATVVSATATRLVVKVPYIVKTNGVLCGNDWGRVRVTVGNKSVLRDEAVKFVGKVEIGLCHPFGVTIGTYPNTYMPGDSSVMSAHLQTLYAKESGYYDKIKLFANGLPIQWVDRYFQGATCGGMTFVLNPMTYAEVANCTVPANYGGGPARKYTFIAKVDGTDIADTTECYIFNQPNTLVTEKQGPGAVSKSAGGNPYIKLKGKYFYIDQIRWTSLQPTFHTSPPGHDLTSTELDFFVPLSLMEPGNTYTATAISACGKELSLFGITINP
jgi:hypothetical protein